MPEKNYFLPHDIEEMCRLAMNGHTLSQIANAFQFRRDRETGEKVRDSYGHIEAASVSRQTVLYHLTRHNLRTRRARLPLEKLTPSPAVPPAVDVPPAVTPQPDPPAVDVPPVRRNKFIDDNARLSDSRL